MESEEKIEKLKRLPLRMPASLPEQHCDFTLSSDLFRVSELASRSHPSAKNVFTTT